MDKQPYIVGVGAANADLNGASLAPIHLRDSNPGHISLSAGGVTRNVCENLARLGADVKLLSCVGDDTFGAFIRRSCEDAGIDASHLYAARGASSSMYLSILDADGDMLVGMSDMRIVQQDMPEDYLPSKKALIQGADVVTCDPCMGEKTLLQLLDLCTPGQIICVDPVSCAYARVVAPFIGRFHTAKPNRMELGILAGMEIQSDSDLERAGEAVLNKGLRRLFVSLGAEGCLYMDDTGTVLRRKLRPAKWSMPPARAIRLPPPCCTPRSMALTSKRRWTMPWPPGLRLCRTSGRSIRT